DRRGRHLPVPALLEVVRRVPQAQPRPPDQLPVDRERRRHPPGARGYGRLRRHRRPDERRAAQGGAGADPPPADRARRRRADLQPARGGAHPLHPRGGRGHLPRQDHALERPVPHLSGKFVQATLGSVAAAAAAAAEKMPEDFRVSITDPAGADAYPIASFTWLLVPARIKDAEKGAAIKKFLAWMLADGQQLAAPLNYAPLPASVVALEQKALAAI